jgi:hypothetical protein
MKTPQMLMYAMIMRKNGMKICDISYMYFSKKSVKIDYKLYIYT